MKTIVVLALAISGSLLAWAETEPNSGDQVKTEIYVPVNGDYEAVEVDSEALIGLLQHTFYECRAVPGGWRRCSKRNGRCFGAVFRNRRQCKQALRHDDD